MHEQLGKWLTAEVVYGLLFNTSNAIKLGMPNGIGLPVEANFILVDCWPSGEDFFVRFALNRTIFTGTYVDNDRSRKLVDKEIECEDDWEMSSHVATYLNEGTRYKWFRAMLDIFSEKSKVLKNKMGSQYRVEYSMQSNALIGFHVLWLEEELMAIRKRL